MDHQALAKSLFRFARIIRCRRQVLKPVALASSSRLRKNVIFEPIFLMAGRRQVRMMAAGARRVRAVRPVLLSSSFLQTDSSRRCQKLWDADNVVGGGSENEEPRDEGPPAMTGLAHHAD